MFDGSNAPSPLVIEANFPKKLGEVVFLPKRYKVFYGGRAAGRSWGIARALAMIGYQRPIRVLCTRELQKSIAESVHAVISDQIRLIGLSSHYDIQRDHIYGANGTVFMFDGIKNNPQKIKSYEGIDYCWVEEAAKVSKASWRHLLPTIRKEGSEVWLSFNPDLETDYTYKRFVKGAREEDSFVIKMTWRDNPWLSRTTLEDIEYDKLNDYDDYLNVWEGHCRTTLEGAIYAKEIRKAIVENRFTQVPWWKEQPVETFWDLGRRDQTCIWFAQRVAMQYRLLDYFEDYGEDITYYIKKLQELPYTYACHYLPHDARAAQLGSKKTIEETIREAFPGRVRIVAKQSVADGINAARMVFDRCWFDETKCSEGISALKHYRFKVSDADPSDPQNRKTYSDKPQHDWASNGADAFRYFAVSMLSPKVDEVGVERFSRAAALSSKVFKSLGLTGPGGWMAS